MDPNVPAGLEFSLKRITLKHMRVFDSSYRHGLTEYEISHAWNNALGFYDIDTNHEPTKGLCIGPDPTGILLELLYLQFADDDVVIHAMRLRPVFRTYLA